MQRHDFTNKPANKEATTSTPARPSLSQRASPHSLHLLQSALGNRAFGRVIQAKLQISRPDDAYEQEADRVAEQVMRMPDAASSEPVIGSALPQISRLQRKCAQCEEEEIRRQPMEEEREEEEEGNLQAKKAPGQTPEVTPGVQAQINTLRGGGQPLSEPLRAFFEPRFGHDFSRVRVHTDSQAAESARAVSARAYTVGSNVVFGAEQYVPHSNEGKRLLAHELTHVVQQSLGAGEGGVGAHGLVQRSISFDDCTVDQQEVIKKAHGRAQEMLAQVIEKLKKYDGTSPSEIKTSLDDNMHDSSVELAAGLAKRLARLAPDGDDTQYECNMKGTARAWSMWCVPFSDVEIHPKWFADPEIDARARTLIHEWLHRYQCAYDLAYHDNPKFAKLSKGQAKMNADSIAWFIYEAR